MLFLLLLVKLFISILLDQFKQNKIIKFTIYINMKSFYEWLENVTWKTEMGEKIHHMVKQLKANNYKWLEILPRSIYDSEMGKSDVLIQSMWDLLYYLRQENEIYLSRFQHSFKNIENLKFTEPHIKQIYETFMDLVDEFIRNSMTNQNVEMQPNPEDYYA